MDNLKCESKDSNYTGRQCDRPKGHSHGHFNEGKSGLVWWWYK